MSVSVNIMITRRSAGSGVDKPTDKTTVHTASLSVRFQNAKKTRTGNYISWHYEMLTKSHLTRHTPKHRRWSDFH